MLRLLGLAFAPTRRLKGAALAATKNHAERDLRFHSLRGRYAAGDDGCVLTLSGEIDIANVASVDGELQRLEEICPASLVIDLRGIEFIDSMAVSMLARAHARATEAGRKLIVRPPADGAARRVLELSGLLRLIPADDEEAVAA